MPRMPKALRLPGALYTAISVAGFACALMTGSACYAVGIGQLFQPVRPGLRPSHDLQLLRMAQGVAGVDLPPAAGPQDYRGNGFHTVSPFGSMYLQDTTGSGVAP